MSLERRLRDHFGASAAQLPEPPDGLGDVARRGRRRRAVERAGIVMGVVVVLAAIPITWGALTETTVDFDPFAPPTATPTPEVTPRVDSTPTPAPTPRGDEARLAPSELQAAVLAYGPHDHGRLELIDREGDRLVWSGPVDAAFPDGRGGVVLQHEPSTVAWVPDLDELASVGIAEVDGEIILRGLMPDGRVLYSVRAQESLDEGDDEAFFAVELADGAEPELMASTPSLETWRVGPAFADDGQPVHASCHLHCTLWPGLAEPPPDAEALYHGGGADAGPSAAIDGLTATPDGRVLAFVEHDPTWPEEYEDRPLELVLLAGTSFNELGRVALPWPAGEPLGSPTVSLSADGQRVLVSLGAGAPPPAAAPPTTPFLVEGALTEDPQVRLVDFAGALRWADPVAAAGPGGPVTAEERDVADRLMAFASDPAGGTFDAVPFATEVSLGLGPDLIGAPRPADELADPDAWVLERDEFRARVGPFSALELLADSGGTRVAGGPHMHCASPPVPVPDELAGLRQISLQGTDGDSCLEWFTVDVFLTDDGEVAAVTLDLYEP